MTTQPYSSPLIGVIEDQSPPSTYAVAAVLDGQRGAIIRAVGLTALRGVLIAPGVYLAGRILKIDGLKGWKLVGTALSASAFITLGMLGMYYLKSKFVPVRAS